MMSIKGSLCSVKGKQYEKIIHDITRCCYIHHIPFNTQKEEELAGSSSRNDIECNFIEEKDIGIEIKKYNTPDWMQCVITYNKETNIWEVSKQSKHPVECIYLLNQCAKLYNGFIPPFMERPYTHDEWIKLKSETTQWDDAYINIPSDTIRKLYQAKGCKYIQISNGYGLYHLGNDICKFDVPIFDIEQQLRIRTKIHTRKNKRGFCNLSLTIACQPKNITKMSKSKYTLDHKDKLPLNLNYNDFGRLF